NPGTYPNFPAIGAQSKSVIQEVDRHLQAPYVMQSAVTVERQLPANTTVAVTFTNSHGLHVLRSEVVGAQPIFLMTSSGLYNQNQLITNVNSRVNAQVSLFGFYVLNKAMSNSDGLATFPANPNNYAGEYGPASTDIRHRFLVGGSINTRWNVRFSPYVQAQSGSPFDITAGSDLYGTTLFNGRPGIATDPSRPGLIATPYGLLDPNPIPGEKLLGRNAGRGPGQISVNLRVGKTIGFGPEKGGGAPSSGGVRAGGGPPLSAPNGMRGLFSPPTTGRKYNLTIGVSARNLLNHNNPGPIIGTITSPLFGRANQIAGTPNGEGFSEAASNRRIEFQIRFQF
ncbi:MAG: Cna domain protein, partial [Bryobacterales bacterium]|nr:Cna domain protein [Bryobacterales bacterium]